MSFERDFYFLRHGQTDWNVARRLQGYEDIPLNATGLKQADDVSSFMETLPIDMVTSSDLDRARTTANRAMAHMVGAPHKQHVGLRERCFGDWEGQLAADAKATIGLQPHDPLTHEYTPPNGETWDEFKGRVFDAISEIQAEYEGNHLFVAHGYVFIALVKTLMDEDSMCDNCTPYHFRKKNGVWVADKLI